MKFRLEKKVGELRIGEMSFERGSVQTPVFMAVGTVGSVKSLSPTDLRDCGVEMVLGNTYHLHLRPGEEIVSSMGGLPKFMNWNGPMLTDSGGFQVFSLGKGAKVDEEGVSFKSHIDGSLRRLNAEKSIEIQRSLGADVIMAFDECTPMTDKTYTKEAMERTHRWLKRSKAEWVSDKANQSLFGIIQGGDYQDLRKESAEFIASQDLPGNAIGGESIGYDMKKTVEQISWVKPFLPEEKPFYAMGAGRDPQDFVDLATSGADMFDCVGPTRLARNGALFVGELKSKGVSGMEFCSTFSKGRLSISKAEWKLDKGPIMDGCDCATCEAGFTRSYLRHLYLSKELLYYRLASIHNVRFVVRLLQEIRGRV